MSAGRVLGRIAVAFAIAAFGCSDLAEPSTGLEGTVTRGPVTPVCVVDVPCSAPFSARFAVWQNSRFVSSFRSDDQGRFGVRLEPGTYRLIPASDAPIIDPESQIKIAVVGPSHITIVELEFDTGIR